MKHLLVARFSAFGDVAMTVPVLRCFLQQNPDVCITFVSQSYLAPLFEGIERLTFVPAYLKDKHKGVLGLKRLWKEIIVASDGKIDYFIDLHSSIRTFIFRVFARLSFIPVCYMRKGRKARRKLTKGGINKHPLRAIPERYADVFRRCGFNVSLEKKSGIKQLPLLPSITEKTGFNPSLPSVGIAPFSQYTGKTYPLEEMYKVVESLAENKDIQVVLVGGRGEEASLLDKWAAPFPNVINAAGKISLSEELSLMSHLNVMVSMDSANMHLCSMVGTRVISIWGATHHFAGFLGFGQSIEDIIEIDDMPCRPCHAFGKKPCRYGTYECMKGIKPHDITSRIKAAL
ncbi:MAG: glycosyltransferase family 9 protein [Flavobacteriales bacterium]|nr:glycosyltransferase family 9 protein [Flavobacteriales bacterium]